MKYNYLHFPVFTHSKNQQTPQSKVNLTKSEMLKWLAVHQNRKMWINMPRG